MTKKPGTVKKAKSNEEEFDMSFFRSRSVADVDPKIMSHLKEQGLVPRWINRKKYIDQGSFHQSGWKPYKLPETLAKDGFGFGANAEGYVVRGDMMLAVRTEKESRMHKKYVEHKTKIQNGSQKKAAEELKSIVGDAVDVLEGYEENGDDE